MTTPTPSRREHSCAACGLVAGCTCAEYYNPPTTPTAKSLDVEELRTLARCLRRFGSAINPDSIQEAAVAINNLLDERAETQRQLSEMAAEVEEWKAALKASASRVQELADEAIAEREHADRLTEAIEIALNYDGYGVAWGSVKQALNDAKVQHTEMRAAK